MPVETKLYPQIKTFYEELITTLEKAQKQISMMYFTFDDGVWAQRIAQTLCERVAAGVDVRLMVDHAGLAGDNPVNIVSNHNLMKNLQKAGVQVTKFNARGNGLGPLNRLHCKITAIDSDTVFLGGSNIGDHYIDWTDTNVRLVGKLGETFHDLYNYVNSFSMKAAPEHSTTLNPSQFLAEDVRVWLTVPRHCTDVRQAYLDLIHNATKSLHIRTWYFLPDKEILEALCAKARSGVRVNVLLSDRTRVRPIDWANFIHANQLAKAGGKPFRFTKGYMHSKAAWNDRNEILLGSANLDPQSLHKNFENLIYLKNPGLAKDLNTAFTKDLKHAYLQTPEAFNRRPLPKQALSHALNIVSVLLQAPPSLSKGIS